MKQTVIHSLALAAALAAIGVSATAGSLNLEDVRQSTTVAPGEAEGFNPQPEPPADGVRHGVSLNPAGKYGFNPQPEPPPRALIQR